MSDHHPISPPTSTYSDDRWMYAHISPSTAASDTSSSTYNDSQNPIVAAQVQPLAQVAQQSFVTQTMDNNFDPDHVINDLFFPMNLDAKPIEYDTSKYTVKSD